MSKPNSDTHGLETKKEGASDIKSPTNNQSEYKISKQELIRFIEIDLWSRFQPRLLQLVGVFLTITALAGLLGVPFYINTQVDKRLAKIESSFSEKNEALTLRYQLLMFLESHYEAEKRRLHHDIELAIIDLDVFVDDLDRNTAMPVDFYLYREIRDDLWRIATATDYSDIIDLQLKLSVFMLDPARRSASFTKKRRIYAATQIGNKASTATVPHPAVDGTLGGTITDIRIRMAMLESYRRGISSVKDDILSIGSSDELSKQTKKAEVRAVYAEIFLKRFHEDLHRIESTFLNQGELSILKEYRSVYDITLEGDIN